MPQPAAGNGRYMAGLDGLRALAVLAVIAYHLNLSWAPGGLLGVGVFFVLSGYLITDILVSQWDRLGRIPFKDFWLRRARRLLPALLVMIVVVVGWVALFDPTQLASLRSDVLAAILYVSNWWYIFHHVPYFARYGQPAPLTHLWSLAVEEQFYLVWPLLLWLGLRYLPKRWHILLLTLLATIASAGLMAWLYHPGADPSRVYYGTDTRAFSLLIGAALALVWPSRRLLPVASPRVRWSLDLCGGLGLLIIGWMVWQTNQYQTSLYRGGMVLLAIATAGVVATLAHPASRLSRLLGFKPLRWLGVRSYGIYLWHYPVIVLTSPAVNTTGVNPLRAVLQVSASIGLAALSWRFVEEPIRKGGLSRAWQRWRERQTRPIRVSPGMALGSLAGIMAVAWFGIGMSGDLPHVVASPESPVTEVRPAPPSQPPVPIAPGLIPFRGETSSANKMLQASQSVPAARPDPKSVTTVAVASKPPSTVTSVAVESGQGVTAIGDSVMVDATPYLKQLLPGIVISAQVGRQMSQAPQVIDQLKAEGKLGNRIILELGTNGDFTQAQLVSILNSLGPVRQIVLVNTRVPRPWQDVTNATLAAVAKSYPHTVLVNWFAASAGKNNFFYPDGVHLNPTGSAFYARLIAHAVDTSTVRR